MKRSHTMMSVSGLGEVPVAESAEALPGWQLQTIITRVVLG